MVASDIKVPTRSSSCENRRKGTKGRRKREFIPTLSEMVVATPMN
jgi:hypothetical protein